MKKQVELQAAKDKVARKEANKIKARAKEAELEKAELRKADLAKKRMTVDPQEEALDEWTRNELLREKTLADAVKARQEGIEATKQQEVAGKWNEKTYKQLNRQVAEVERFSYMHEDLAHGILAPGAAKQSAAVELQQIFSEMSQSADARTELANLIKREHAALLESGGEVVGENDGSALDDDFFKAVDETTLKNSDYGPIKHYFDGDEVFSELSPDQQQMVESLRYSSEDFNNNFATPAKAATARELRSLIEYDLVNDGVVSHELLNSFEQNEQPFSEHEVFALAESGDKVGPPSVRKNLNEAKELLADPKTKALLDPEQTKAVENYIELKQDLSINNAQLGEMDAAMNDILKTVNRVKALEGPVQDRRVVEPKAPEQPEGKHDGGPDGDQDYFDEVAERQAAIGAETEMTEMVRRDVQWDVEEPETAGKIMPFEERTPFADYKPFSEGPFEMKTFNVADALDMDLPASQKQIGQAINDALKYRDSQGGGLGADATNEAFADRGSELGLAFDSTGEAFLSRSTLTNWIDQQKTNIKMAPAFIALNSILNRISPEATQYFNLGMSALALTSGDPLPLIMMGAQKLMQSFTERGKRIKDNDTPASEYGSKFGYVREGDKWYPALFKSTHKGDGLWAGSQENRMIYDKSGTGKIVWETSGDGTKVPTFTDPVTKSFIVHTNELTGEQSQKDAIDTRYFTREWYYLDEKDAKKAMSGNKVFSAYEEDTSKMNGSERQLNSWRKAAEMAYNYKWAPIKKAHGVDAVPDDTGSRELQRLMFDDAHMTGGGFRAFLSANKAVDVPGYGEIRKRGQTTKQSIWNNRAYPEANWLFETMIHDSVATLYRTQRVAAKEQGFDELYQSVPTKEYYALQGGSETKAPTTWSTMYLDTANDMPIAKDADQLQDQIDSISKKTDRSKAQKDYLVSKATTRFWMQQAADIGGADELVGFLYGDNKRMREMTQHAGIEASDIARRVENKWTMGPLTSLDKHGNKYDYAQHYRTDLYKADIDKKSGWLVPWMNGGEGILPDLTFDESVEMSDLVSKYKLDAINRMSKEAETGAAEVIKAASGLDPNLYLTGVKDRDMAEAGRKANEKIYSYGEKRKAPEKTVSATEKEKEFGTALKVVDIPGLGRMMVTQENMERLKKGLDPIPPLDATPPKPPTQAELKAESDKRDAEAAAASLAHQKAKNDAEAAALSGQTHAEFTRLKNDLLKQRRIAKGVGPKGGYKALRPKGAKTKVSKYRRAADDDENPFASAAHDLAQQDPEFAEELEKYLAGDGKNSDTIIKLYLKGRANYAGELAKSAAQQAEWDAAAEKKAADKKAVLVKRKQDRHESWLAGRDYTPGPERGGAPHEGRSKQELAAQKAAMTPPRPGDDWGVRQEPVVTEPSAPPTKRVYEPDPVDTLAGMTRFQRYMFEQHGQRISKPDVHREDHPYLAFTRTGEVALYGDEELEKRLGLADNIHAVQSANGIIHQVFDPHVEVPKFIGSHDVAQPHQENVLVN